MNLSLKKVAGSLSFAHLAGLGRGKAAKAEDDEKKDRDTEDVNDGAKKGKADADEPDEDDKKKDGPDARAEDDDPDAESDDPEKKDDDDEKKSKKAKASDDDQDEKKDDEKMKAAALAERARCAAIFASPAAAKNVALAAELAFKTDLSAEQAVGVLGKAPAAATNLNRAAGNPRIAGGGGPEITGKQAVDSSWDRAFSKVTPPKRR